MTPDIQRLAKEAGPELYNLCLSHRGPLIPDLIKFADLVAEECAKVVDAEGVPVSGVWLPELDFQRKYSAAIRAKFALSNKDTE